MYFTKTIPENSYFYMNVIVPLTHIYMFHFNSGIVCTYKPDSLIFSTVLPNIGCSTLYPSICVHNNFVDVDKKREKN